MYYIISILLRPELDKTQISVRLGVYDNKRCEDPVQFGRNNFIYKQVYYTNYPDNKNSYQA